MVGRGHTIVGSLGVFVPSARLSLTVSFDLSDGNRLRLPPFRFVGLSFRIFLKRKGECLYLATCAESLERRGHSSGGLRVPWKSDSSPLDITRKASKKYFVTFVLLLF